MEAATGPSFRSRAHNSSRVKDSIATGNGLFRLAHSLHRSDRQREPASQELIEWGGSPSGPEPSEKRGRESPEAKAGLAARFTGTRSMSGPRPLKQWVQRKSGNRQLVCSGCGQRGGNRARRMGSNPNSVPSMLETATGRLATTEVNVGLRPRTTLTVPSWPPLIEHVEWPNREVSRDYALRIDRAEPR